MIGAAVEAAQGEGSPPAELKFCWSCQRWGTLPEGGGMFDQNYGLITRMVLLDAVYRIIEKLPHLVGKEIHKLTSQERRLLKWLKDEGLWQM